MWTLQQQLLQLQLLLLVVAVLVQHQRPGNATVAEDAAVVVHWYAPFLAGGGFASEASAFVVGLARLSPTDAATVAVRAVNFAEPPRDESVRDVEPEVRRAMTKAVHVTGARGRDVDVDVVVCHSTPDAWVPSAFPGWDRVAPCPPAWASVRVGRAMFETDRVPASWVPRLNRMDAVWVPSAFHLTSFSASGVLPDKLVVVPEPVDTEWFDPSLCPPRIPTSANETTFVSVFKWEARKGWRVLLGAFLDAVRGVPSARLVIKTSRFHSQRTPQEEAVAAFPALEEAISRGAVVFLQDHFSRVQLRELYCRADAVVQPSFGEGWGRPHAEAMAMGRALLATDWSGTTEFLSSSVGFPIKVERLVPAPPEGEGHQWALPSQAHLAELMVHVARHPHEARERGAAARELMVRKFGLRPVAELVVEQVCRLAEARRSKQEL